MIRNKQINSGGEGANRENEGGLLYAENKAAFRTDQKRWF